ncbi:unnamed protein product [Fraxinus pennsylvanica]|uniref:PGG domain-containing protein n=1 Tax=Fraxinus pennsylvanica TaxID=56036 RepID=A0AAD1ZQ79_9LAMI|nr:unnamed protein product [Fraxinus pennsylvanica]
MASQFKETPTPIEEEISLDDLFDLTMKKKWSQVETAYKRYPSTRRAKLTKSEETSLHVAISSYHSELHSSDCEKHIVGMINSIGDDFEILSIKNDKGDTPLHLAAAVGWLSICEYIALNDHLDSSGKNALMLAAENRQTTIFNYLVEKKLPEFVFHQFDDQGNSILHLAAMLGELQPWLIPGAALQMQWEIKWYKHVKHSVPPLSFAHNNNRGETPRKIFIQTHRKLVKEGTNWLIKTSESCSVIAALIATVAFATSATVPGGLKEDTGHPVLENKTAFDVFSVTSLVALTLSVTALVFFLSINTSRWQERDFKLTLPRKLLLGLSSLFASIVAMLISFCAGHTFILREKLRYAAVPIYGVAFIPVAFFALVQLQLCYDLLWSTIIKVPLRSYKAFHD